ncbi:MAG: ribose 5-phosphate isomerase A [archaeon]|nr:ribose 5-phosphate isomerase A [archaeon]
MLSDDAVEEFVAKFVNDNDTVAIGTSKLGENFAIKLALRAEKENLNIKFVPTSSHMATIISHLRMPTASINDLKIDVAFEFADMIDKDFNFIKNKTLSLVRDKMIAETADKLIVVADREFYVKKLFGSIPFEVVKFGYKHSFAQLERLGKASMRNGNKGFFTTETNNYLIDVAVDEVFDLDNLDYATKKIPGVIETGLFTGYADKIILHDDKIHVKSRIF